MIGRLSGILLHKEPPSLVLDVGGVGYEIDAPMSTFYELPATGQSVTLYTHLVVRDDAHLLFGFSRVTQRQLFRHLLKVTGVGPRVALAILSGLTDQEFMQCLMLEDVARLIKVPGIGRKTAERLIIDMRDKVDPALMKGGATTRQSVLAADPVQEAISALLALGYKPPEASRAVQNIPSDGLSSEEIIRQALKGMVGSR
ncbi:MAG: Holliday junction DNA helicase RuvA [Candidatus Muproteobacteria bacterium RBG_19FT_COMBO_61_10]|jgi:Holliday junction DNA helicase RuvA|uniref:Holliday junction branch migration complex subunit RuvA n=1 Tax=Candidatus Muproteobacteria bacterium RBG_19FT_COMBO_61_10 TaxID=1817761 RepID=A0A1F6UPC6_9PROT|nr:MAG: Holliday junction DNA helicase RuvA [Candidatus Muproteobacteria bacterium RBG_19FT_COMBO_61_10]